MSIQSMSLHDVFSFVVVVVVMVVFVFGFVVLDSDDDEIESQLNELEYHDDCHPNVQAQRAAQTGKETLVLEQTRTDYVQ